MTRFLAGERDPSAPLHQVADRADAQVVLGSLVLTRRRPFDH